MTRPRFMTGWALLPVLAGALLLALTAPAAAQQEACVHLQVGSGYAATMQVNFEGGVIGPSPRLRSGKPSACRWMLCRSRPSTACR